MEPGGKGGGVGEIPLAGQGVDAVAGADADGRRAADLEELDGVIHLLRRAQGQVYRPVGQLGLVNNDHAFPVAAQAYVVNMGHLLKPVKHKIHS